MVSRSVGEAFIERILGIVEAGSYRDPSVFDGIFTEDAVLHTPRFWKPITDQRWLKGVLSMVPQAIEGFAYHRTWIDGQEVLMEFRGTIDGKSLHGLDIFTLDDDGRVRELTVMVRPPNALAALGEKEDALLAKLFGAATQAAFAGTEGKA